MDAFTVVAVFVVVVVLGMMVIHQLHRRQHDRNMAFHYSETMPGVGRRQRGHHRPVARPEQAPRDATDGSDGSHGSHGSDLGSR
ncbi:hypothetical protein OG711_19260 [Streptomyces uncialis]|uniref:hypothetical protein n=1 Tax=Streptomyces uncialis TaxID=1048205 RepID=UPI002E2F20C6|nr:hypothetical protein [Streptomyces uncialis]